MAGVLMLPLMSPAQAQAARARGLGARPLHDHPLHEVRHFVTWLVQQSYFADSEQNTDLARLGPIEVLNAFFDAINKGDKTRATACLSPLVMLNSLTVNLSGQKRLYNAGFSRENSLVDNIRQVKLISYERTDLDNPAVQKTQVGDHLQVAVMVDLDITWQDQGSNTPSGRTIRFASFEKYPSGWKLTGLGTGP